MTREVVKTEELVILLVNGINQTEVKMEPIRKDMELLSNSMASYAHIKGETSVFVLLIVLG